MLFARGERQHIPALAIHVLGFAHDAARHLAQELLLASDYAAVRPAVAHRHAERLRFHRNDVRLLRRLHDSQRHGFRDRHDQQRAPGVRHLRNRRDILDGAKEVRRLDHHARRLAGDRGIQSSHIHAPIRRIPNLGNRNFLVLRVGRDHLAILRMHRPGYHGFIPSGHADSHHHRLGRASRPVVHRRVRNLHTGQLTDHGLELEHCLQRALRYLRLVGRVAGQELAAQHQAIDDDRLVVPVHARAQKAGIAGGVVLGKRTEAVDDLRLRVLPRNVEVARELILSRDRLKQRVDRLDANLLQHLLAVRRRLGQIAH